jgi:DNA-directed RNA polymerase specialized sigma24 family protein
MSRHDIRWLAGLQLWAGAIVRSLHVAEADIADLVLEAFARVKNEWSRFKAPEDIPARTARRRWIAQLLFRIAAEYRRTKRRAPDHETPGTEAPGNEARAAERAADETAAEPQDGMITVRGLRRRFRRTTPAERLRVWIAREIDGAPLTEIALQEGRTLTKVYRLLELARRDFAVALAREEAAASAGPDRAPR